MGEIVFFIILCLVVVLSFSVSLEIIVCKGFCFCGVEF